MNKIKAGGDGVGLRMYDPGYVNTTAVVSRICFIDGAKGILRYRGYPIEQVWPRLSSLLQQRDLIRGGHATAWLTELAPTHTLKALLQHSALHHSKGQAPRRRIAPAARLLCTAPAACVHCNWLHCHCPYHNAYVSIGILSCTSSGLPQAPEREGSVQIALKSNFLDTSFCLLYGELPSPEQAQSWHAAVMRHAQLPAPVVNAIEALPADAHPMSIVMSGVVALGTLHPEQNPALAGQSIYNSKELSLIHI